MHLPKPYYVCQNFATYTQTLILHSKCKAMGSSICHELSRNVPTLHHVQRPVSLERERRLKRRWRITVYNPPLVNHAIVDVSRSSPGVSANIHMDNACKFVRAVSCYYFCGQ